MHDETFGCGKGTDRPFRLRGLSDRKSRVAVFGQVGKHSPASFSDNLKAAAAAPQRDSRSTP